MKPVTLREAANLVGKSHQTIYRYVREGRLSVTKGPDGVQRVEVSELHRVFGNLNRVTGETVTSDAMSNGVTRQDEVLEAELKAARELLDATRQALRSAEEREQRLLGVVEAQTRLLEDRRPKAEPDNSPTESDKSRLSDAGWFAAGIMVVLGIVLLSILTR